MLLPGLTTNDCRLSAGAVPLRFLKVLIIAMQNFVFFFFLSSSSTTYPVGDTILTWHFTDAAGNTTTCPSDVDRKDKFIRCDCDTLKNIVAELTTNGCRLAAMLFLFPIPQSIDNCDLKLRVLSQFQPLSYQRHHSYLAFRGWQAIPRLALKLTVKISLPPH